MKHNTKNETQERALVEAGVIIKLGLDVHARQITVCRQIGDRTPQPAQAFTKERLLGWVRKMLEAGAVVHSCYEASVMGYTLHRELEALGVKNIVVAPQKLCGPKRQKTDALDARALVGRSTRPLVARQPRCVQCRPGADARGRAGSRASAAAGSPRPHAANGGRPRSLAVARPRFHGREVLVAQSQMGRAAADAGRLAAVTGGRVAGGRGGLRYPRTHVARPARGRGPAGSAAWHRCADLGHSCS